MKDLISIIIPYYKKKEFFQKTIESVKKQSYKNFEVIVIFDDIDKSDLSFVNHNLKNFKKKKIIINKKNLGVGVSRNLGLKRSKGKFIAFLDADDVWHKDKIKKQVNFMKKNKVDFSFCNYLIINQNDKIIKKIIAPKKIIYKKLLTACDIGLSTVMITSKLLKTFIFPSLRTKEDYLLWLRLSRNNTRMLGFNKTLARWRITDNSLSSSGIQKLKDAFQIYNKHLKFSFIKSLFNVLVLSLNFLIKRHL